jgi:hypothetical protein
MGSLDLLLICSLSFLSVFFVLSLLAVVMRLITEIFPQRRSDMDTTVYAAISATAAEHFPGTRITKIEELK